VVFSPAVNRRRLRLFLVFALVVSAGFAAWSWFRPYEWSADPAAHCKVVGTQVKSDRSYYWIDVHLKMLPGQTHDLAKPVFLRTGDGKKLEPADTTLVGSDQQRTSEIWLKFWLENSDMRGSLTLHINDGSLVIKAASGLPDLGSSGLEYFVTNQW
jgi:hypothetical protein